MKKLYIYTFSLLTSLLGISLGNAVAQSITVSGVPSAICANEAFTIGYSTSGLTINAGNVFVAELSDSFGDFSFPVLLGTETSQDIDGTIYVIIPETTPLAFGYRIRVIATETDLGVIGAINALDIDINCTTRDYYWVNGGGNWSDMSHWEYTINDVDFFFASELPTSNDNVNFDDQSFPDGGTLNVDIVSYCNDMYWDPSSGATGPQLFAPTNVYMNIRGDLIMADGVYRDVYNFTFSTEKKYLTVDLADNTIRLNSNTWWAGDFRFLGNGTYYLEGSMYANSISLSDNAVFDSNDQSIDLEFEIAQFSGTSEFYAQSSNIRLQKTHMFGFFDPGTSSIVFYDNGSGAMEGNAYYNNVIFEEGDYTLYGNDSILNLKLMPDVKIKIDPGAQVAVTGNFESLGTRSKMIDIQSTTAGAISTLNLYNSSALVNFVILQDNTVTASSQPVNAANSIDNGNNTNWNIAAIAPQSYFWIGGAGNWSDVNNWATTDGGTTLRTEPPGPVDNVNITPNSFPNGGQLTIDIVASCNDFIWTDGSTNPSIGASSDFSLTVRGSFELPQGVTRDIYDLRFESIGNNVITFSDNQIYTSGKITFDGTGSWSMQDSLSTSTLNVENGTLNTNNNTLNLDFTLNIFNGMINLGSSIINTHYIQGDGSLINSGTSTFIFTDWGRIATGNTTFNDVIFNGDDCIIFNNQSYENITINAGADVQIASGTTQNFNQSLTINGTRNNMATLRSYSPGNQAFFTADIGAIVTANYVNLSDNNATGTTFGAANSFDNGNNAGWTISAIMPDDYYWINGGGNWSDYENHWSDVSGGAPNVMTEAPGPLDDVFFTGLSSFVQGNTDTVTLDVPATVHNMTWQDGSEKPLIDDGLDFNELTITGSLFFANGVSKSLSNVYFESSSTSNLIDFKDNLGSVGSIWFDGGGSWTSVDSLAGNNILIIDGTFKTNSNDLNVSRIYYQWGDTGSEIPILDLGNSEVNVFSIDDNPGTGQLISGGSTVRIEPGGYIDTDGHNYNNVVFKGGGSLYGSNSYSSIRMNEGGDYLSLLPGSTSTINFSLTLAGVAGAPINLNSISPGTQATISMPGTASVTANLIQIYDNNAIGGALFTATNSVQFSNVTGWTGLLTGQTLSLKTNDALFSDGSVTLNGSSSSGLGLQYSITQGDASISSNVVTPNSTGLVGILATQPGDGTFAEVSAKRYIHFNATSDPNELGIMKAASYVVGQVDFESSDTFYDVNKTPGARQALVTPDGKLVTTGSRRALVWNQVPDKADVPADLVIGQPNFITTDFAVNASTIYSTSYGVAMADDGRLLISDSRGILIWNTFPTQNGQAADVIIGQSDFNSTQFGAGPDRFNGPAFFTITPDQKLIVSDLTGGRVLIFNQIPTTNGASADIVLGQSDFYTNEAGDGPNGMNRPSYSAIDADGKLYIPDASNNRVLVYNSVPTVSGTPPDAVLGQPDLNTNIEDQVSGTIFNFPYSVSISRTGKMAISDRSNNRILIYNSPPTNNTVEPNFILGQPDAFTSDVNGGNTINNRGFNVPYAAYWDAAENLFVGDISNSRYLVWGAPDFDVPAIENSTIPTPYVSESGVNAVFTLVERSGLQQADAYFRFISSPDPSFILGGLSEESENVWSFDLTGIDIVDEPLGMEFYIDIKDGYGNAFDNQSNPQSTNIVYPDGLPITEFGVGSATTDYRLFAVPLELQDKDAKNVFNEVFAGTYDKSKMRIFSYAGGAATTFTEYGSGFSSFEVGRGYFGLAAAATSVTSGGGQTVPYLNQGLGDGWQLIGNPYDFSLNWSDIEAASSFDASQVQAPRGYDDGNYSTGQAVIGPGEGVFVLNKTGGTLNLVFPVANNVGDRIMEQEDNINDLSSDSWEVRFLNGIGDKEHQIGAVGMELDADQSIDRYDMAVPPAIGSMGSIIFNHPEYFVSGFDVDIKPTSTSDNWAFTFSAGENADEEQEISWDNSYYGYNTPDLYLVDKTHFEVINMKENESYQFKYSGDTKFEVYYGENALSALLPEKLEVQTPYPNPFNESVKINIGLPIASNDYKVVVAIYNTMGKQVTTLNNANMNGGFYSFNWAGTNDSGLEVADGIYAYRIVTSGEISSVVTGKVIKK